MQKDKCENSDKSDKVDRSVVIWHYEGRQVPVEVIWPTEDEEDRLLGIVAEFVWNNRNLLARNESDHLQVKRELTNTAYNPRV